MKGSLKGLLVAGVVVLFSGCAAQQPVLLTKAGGSEQEYNQDAAGCEVQMQYIQMADWEYRGTIMEGVNVKQKQQKAYFQCMFSKGYTTVARK